MGGVFVFPGGSQVVLQAGVPEPYEGFRVLFNGLCLSDGRSDSCDADLNHGLVIVIGLIILLGRKTPCKYYGKESLKGPTKHILSHLAKNDSTQCAWR